MSWAQPYQTRFTPADDAVEPVDLDQIKQSIRGLEDVEDFDDELIKKGIAARQKLERLSGGVSFISGTASFYVNVSENAHTISQIPYAYDPSVITNLKVYGVEDGEADELHTVNEDYYLMGSEVKFSGTGRRKVTYDVEIDPDSLPEAIRQGILLEVEAMFEKVRDTAFDLHQQALETIKPYGHVWL